MSADEEQLVGRSYTRARRHPLVIGKLPGAGRLPGGPYTITQIVTMVVAFVVMVATHSLWAHFGLVDIVLIVVVPWGLAWVLRYARLDGRDPARALRSLLVYLSSPSDGRLSGHVLHTRRPHLAAGACTVRVRSAEGAPVERAEQPAPAVSRPASTSTSASTIVRPTPESASPAPSAPAVDRPGSGRTGLQDLLAALEQR